MIVQVLKNEGYFVASINGEMSAAKRLAVSFCIISPLTNVLHNVLLN